MRKGAPILDWFQKKFGFCVFSIRPFKFWGRRMVSFQWRTVYVMSGSLKTYGCSKNWPISTHQTMIQKEAQWTVAWISNMSFKKYFVECEKDTVKNSSTTQSDSRLCLRSYRWLTWLKWQCSVSLPTLFWFERKTG